MALKGRHARLLIEYEKLINLETRSEFIKIEPIDWIEGMPPENYIITFTCLGIAGLNSDNTPQFSEFHQVSMKISSNFPNQEPYLKWLTPIWHPNIQHKEPHHVCTDTPKNWYSTKSLDYLVTYLGELVQYKNYHAEWSPPYPDDKEAADWVINFGEPNGIVGKDKPVDPRPLLREKKIRRRNPAYPPYRPPKSSGKIKIGVKNSKSVEHPEPEKKNISIETPLAATAASYGNSTNVSAEPVRKRGITLGLKTKEVVCIRCYDNFTVPNIPLVTRTEFVCEKCQEFIKIPD